MDFVSGFCGKDGMLGLLVTTLYGSIRSSNCQSQQLEGATNKPCRPAQPSIQRRLFLTVPQRTKEFPFTPSGLLMGLFCNHYFSWGFFATTK